MVTVVPTRQVASLLEPAGLGPWPASRFTADDRNSHATITAVLRYITDVCCRWEVGGFRARPGISTIGNSLVQPVKGVVAWQAATLRDGCVRTSSAVSGSAQVDRPDESQVIMARPWDQTVACDLASLTNPGRPWQRLPPLSQDILDDPVHLRRAERGLDHPHAPTRQAGQLIRDPSRGLPGRRRVGLCGNCGCTQARQLAVARKRLCIPRPSRFDGKHLRVAKQVFELFGGPDALKLSKGLQEPDPRRCGPVVTTPDLVYKRVGRTRARAALACGFQVVAAFSASCDACLAPGRLALRRDREGGKVHHWQHPAGSTVGMPEPVRRSGPGPTPGSSPLQLRLRRQACDDASDSFYTAQVVRGQH
jgi:hypothetical protein